MKTLGGDIPLMFSLAISGMLLRKYLTLTIIGQRVLPHRNLAPLHKTHRLSSLARATIWLLSAKLLLFRMSFNQLSEARMLCNGFEFRVMLYLHDDCISLICFPHSKM